MKSELLNDAPLELVIQQLKKRIKLKEKHIQGMKEGPERPPRTFKELIFGVKDREKYISKYESQKEELESFLMEVEFYDKIKKHAPYKT